MNIRILQALTQSHPYMTCGGRSTSGGIGIGGSLIPLVRGRNLHALWDGILGRRNLLRDVDREVAELWDRKRYGDVWVSAAKQTDPREWAKESHELCKSVVYSDAILNAIGSTPAGAEVSAIELPTSYTQQAGDVARRRIIQAGVRLGSLLKEVSHHQ
jgi:hypothetical protein